MNRLFEAEGDFFGPLAIGILTGRAAAIDNKAEQGRVLDLIWQADRQIKEKGLDGKLAIEALLIKILS